MPDIFHHFPIQTTLGKVFEAVSTPSGLDVWWTKRSSGEPRVGAEYQLWFGPEYDWRATVSRYKPQSEFELEVTEAHQDWQDTRVGFRLQQEGDLVQVLFHHLDWVDANQHYTTSCFCWAMYLRLLKRFLEYDEVVPYEDRLDA